MSSSWRRMTLSGWKCWELRVKSLISISNTVLRDIRCCANEKWAIMVWSSNNLLNTTMLHESEWANKMYRKLIDFGIRYGISRIMPFSRVDCLNSIPKACNICSQWLDRVLRAQSVSLAQLMDISPVSYLDTFPKDNHISSEIEREAPPTNGSSERALSLDIVW